jgi:P-type Mg2+ transporter
VLHRFPSHGRQAYSGRRATNLDLDQGHNHTSAHASAAAKAPREFWTGPAAAMLAQLQTSPAGLSSAEAAARLVRYGTNDAASVRRTPRWLGFLARLRNPLVIVLLIASLFSAVTGDVSSFVIVLCIVLLSMVLDFVQESRAQDAIEALRRSVAIHATVRRDGKVVSVPADQVVPGDVVELIAGDLVPADARLLEGRDLFVNEALLTGEPYPAEKHASDAVSAAVSPMAAQNTVFAGTSVISGTATALICRTGHATILGSLAAHLAEKPPATEFAVGIRRFGLMIVRLTMLLVLFVLVVNVVFERPLLESLMFALALAVGLTPEMLPMIVTVTLSRAAIQLAKRQVIVKRLAAIHDIGAMDVLCTDKTGTLTEARIALVRAIDGEGANSAHAFTLAYVNSSFETGMKSPLDEAILTCGGCEISAWTKLDEVPFDFERRRVSILAEHAGERQLIVKGAPEDVLHRAERYVAADGTEAELDDAARARFAVTFAGLSAQGLRALGVASRVVGAEHTHAGVADEVGLVFAGFVAFLDPPKASAGATIAALRRDGIAVKVLTGDNEQVARYVFETIGVTVVDTLTGDQVAHLTDEALLARVQRTNLFCRVSPQQKLRVLMALKRLGHVVGFMGDGINDAPALHAADVGVSVDGAADVAREAADLILLQHDLSVVHDATLAGRATVQNVAKYILMGSSSNFGNMFSMAGAALFLPFLPMLPIQVLLNNLLYDISQIAIPFDRVDPEATMYPTRWHIGLIQRFMLVFGPISSLFDFLTFYTLIALFGAGETLFQTGWFIESLATQVLVIFAIRSRRHLLQSWPHPLLAGMAVAIVLLAVALPFTRPGHWFGFVAPPAVFFVYLVTAVIAYLALVELVKRWFYGHDDWVRETRYDRAAPDEGSHDWIARPARAPRNIR